MDKATVKIQKRLAKAVTTLRTQNNWSQEECAENLGIATAYLSRIERAQVNVTLRNLVRISTGFDVDISDLLKP